MGCEVAKLIDANPQKSIEYPTILFTDQFKHEQIQQLFNINESIGVVFLDCSDDKRDSEMYGVNQYDYVSFPAIKIESYSTECIESVITLLFQIDQDRVTRLANKLFDATMGQYTSLRYLIQILLTEGKIVFNAQRQRWDFSDDIEIDRIRLVLKQVENLSQNEKHILVALISPPGSVPNNVLYQVLNLRSDVFYQSLESLRSKMFIESESGHTRIRSEALRAALKETQSHSNIAKYRDRFRNIYRGDKSTVLESVYYSTDDCLATMGPELLTQATNALKRHKRVDKRIVRSSIDRINEKITEPDWGSHQAEVLRYYDAVALVESEWGNSDRLAAIYQNYISRGVEAIERSRVLSCFIEVLKKNQRYEQALDIGLDWLRMIGISISRHPSKSQLAIDYLKTSLLLRARGDWIKKGQLKIAVDPDSFEINKIIANLAGAAYMGSPPVFALLCFLGMKRAVKYGVTAENAFGIAGFAFCESQISFGDQLSLPHNLNRASMYLRTARAVVAKFDGQFKHRVDLIEYGFINNWRDNQEISVEQLQQTYVDANRNGDTEYALYTGAIGSILAFTKGGPLSEVLSMSRLAYIQSVDNGQSTTTNNISLLFQLVGTLSGEPTDIPDNIMNLSGHWNAEFARQETYGRFDQTTKIVFLTFQLFRNIWSNSIGLDSYELLTASRQCLDGLQGQQITVLYAFLECILLAEKSENKRSNKRFSRNLSLFQQLINESSKNYEAYWLFLQGLKYKNQRDTYISFWEQSYEVAVRNEQWHLAGYVSERIARFFMSVGDHANSKRYFICAANGYDTWQAYELSKKIRQEHALLFKSELPLPVIATLENRYASVLDELLTIRTTCSSGERYLESLLMALGSKLALQKLSLFEIDLYNDIRVTEVEKGNEEVSYRSISQADLSTDQQRILRNGGFKHSAELDNHVFTYSLHNESCFAFIELVASGGRIYNEDSIFEIVLAMVGSAVKENYLSALLNVKHSSMQPIVKLPHKGIFSALINDTEERLKSSDTLIGLLKKKYALDTQDEIVIDQYATGAKEALDKIDSTVNYFDSIDTEALNNLKQRQLVIVADRVVDQVELEILKAVVKSVTVISYGDLSMRAAKDLTPSNVLWLDTNTDLAFAIKSPLFSLACRHYVVGTTDFSRQLGLIDTPRLSSILDFIKLENCYDVTEGLRPVESPIEYS